jgi:hypothetical protein
VVADPEFIAVLENAPDQRLSANDDLLAISDLVNHEAPLATPDPGVEWGYAVPLRLQDHVALWISPERNGAICHHER